MTLKNLKLKVLSAAMCMTLIASVGAMGITANAATTTTASYGEQVVASYGQNNSYTYMISDGVVHIFDISDSGTTVRIPAEVEGKTKIYLHAKAITKTNCPNAKVIVIPAGVTTIEKNAFYQCNQVKRIMINDSNTAIKIQTNNFTNLQQVYANKKVSSTYINNLKSKKTVTRYANVSNTSTISIVGGKQSGTTWVANLKKKITLTAGTNAKNATYSFAIRNIKNPDYTVKQTWSTNNTYITSFLNTPGTYYFRVGVKDVNGVTAYKYFKVKVEEITATTPGSVVIGTLGDQYNKETMPKCQIELSGVKTTGEQVHLNAVLDKTNYTRIFKTVAPGQYTLTVHSELSGYDGATIDIKVAPGEVVRRDLFPAAIRTCNITMVPASNDSATTSTALKDVKFVLKGTTYSGDLVTYNSKIQNGQPMFKNIQPGQYILTVVKVPTGYIINQKEYPIEIKGNSDIFVQIPLTDIA